jgi:hypothetical protein
MDELWYWIQLILLCSAIGVLLAALYVLVFIVPKYLVRSVMKK